MKYSGLKSTKKCSISLRIDKASPSPRSGSRPQRFAGAAGAAVGREEDWAAAWPSGAGSQTGRPASMRQRYRCAATSKRAGALANCATCATLSSSSTQAPAKSRLAFSRGRWR